MKKKLIRRGTLLMIIGILMIAVAAGFALYNRNSEIEAQEASGEMISQLEQIIQANKIIIAENTVTTAVEEKDWYADLTKEEPENITNPTANEQVIEKEVLPDGVYYSDMYYAVIEDHFYIGILTMPTLNLSLPIQYGWDDVLMKISPCRYDGSQEDNNLIIMAHNYATHFGLIKNLAVGDIVYYTDVLGRQTEYEVTRTDVFHRQYVNQMYEGDWDMTLFTCVPNTYNRIAVRLKRVNR